MTQLTGTARRSTSQAPLAFVAGTLFAVAAMATVIVLALALGVNVGLRDDAIAAQAAAAAPSSAYDGRLDPIERAYIRGLGVGTATVPRAGVTTYDNSLDPMEQAYIDDAHASTGAAAVDRAQSRAGLPGHRLVQQ